MRHFEVTQWADFCRGVVDTERRTAMAAHLVSCRRCVDLVERFERVVAVSSAAATVAPPDYAVRSAKALFSLDRPERESAWRRFQLQVTFDSALSPRPIGVRSSQSERRLVYEAKNHSVEVIVAPPSGSEPGLIAGELTRQQNGPLRPMPTVPAMLVSNQIVTGTAVTNEQGAFSFEPGVSGPYELWFFPEDHSMISLSLADPADELQPA